MAHVNISIDDDIVKQAKEGMINISQTAERAIKERLNYKEIKIGDRCEFCGKTEPKASKETNYIGLTWLCPDERWICEGCLDSKKRKVSVTKA